MAYDSRTDRATVTWEKKAERARRYSNGKSKRLNNKAARRQAYREYGEYDA